jgi:hypothetical protein
MTAARTIAKTIARTAIAARWRWWSAIVALAVIGPVPTARAQPSVPSFFAGKQINLFC